MPEIECFLDDLSQKGQQAPSSQPTVLGRSTTRPLLSSGASTTSAAGAANRDSANHPARQGGVASPPAADCRNPRRDAIEAVSYAPRARVCLGAPYRPLANDPAGAAIFSAATSTSARTGIPTRKSFSSEHAPVYPAGVGLRTCPLLHRTAAMGTSPPRTRSHLGRFTQWGPPRQMKTHLPAGIQGRVGCRRANAGNGNERNYETRVPTLEQGVRRGHVFATGSRRCPHGPVRD